MKKLTEFGGFQGDIVLIVVGKLPEDAKPTENRVVAYGESTGHHHIVTGDALGWETDDAWYYQAIGNDVRMHHVGDDHEDIEIAPGLIFRVPKLSQVEYDGRNERRVMD